MSGIKRAITTAQAPEEAAQELAEGLMQPGCCLVLLFVSPGYDMQAVAQALEHYFPGARVAGCTTAGEIGPGGYAEGSIAGVSFAGPDFAASIGLIEALSRKDVADMQSRVRQTRLAIYDAAPWARHENMFALSLVDGMCGCEELLANAACGALAGIPLRGGSAGDGLHFEKTFILHEGVFRRDCALIIVMATRRRFHAFKTEHVAASGERVVVTGADPVRRVVTEINAEPAAIEYGRIIGFPPADLGPAVFATHPMVVRVGEQIFVRSIQRMNADLSLTFFCAIDEGVVLTVGSCGDLMANLEASFGDIGQEMGTPEVVIGFDCILRGLELEQNQQRRQAGALLDRNNVLGFSTYGEQYEAMHVNQTLTGIAIGAANA
jgi:hypothetical protein